MAVATDITGLSDDEIVERLRQRTEEYNKLKAEREAAKTADPETGKAKKPWYMPKERPPISAFLMPLMLLYCCKLHDVYGLFDIPPQGAGSGVSPACSRHRRLAVG